jgi:hypothetical protein
MPIIPSTRERPVGDSRPFSLTPRITSKAILIGYDPHGTCVYSQVLELSDYYDRQHVWDRANGAKRLNLQRVKGYLFDADGAIDQEFESIFDVDTGIYKTGTTRYADGTLKTFP